MSPKVDVPSLANSVVLDCRGRQLKLGQVWQSSPVILIFLRHFACIACRGHAAQVWADREAYERTGAKLIFIGNGHPEFIDIFKTELGLGDALVLTDPSLESFRAAGLRNGYLAVIQLKSAINAIKLAADGHRQTEYSREAGTHWQLGGVLALNTSGEVTYHFVSQSLGDVPNSDVEIIVDAEDKLNCAQAR